MRGIRVAVWRGLVLAVVLLALAACGGKSGSASAASPTSETVTNPQTEGTGTEAPGRTASGVAVSVPTLPVGGQEPDRTVHQCANASWTGSQVIEGAQVRVTGVNLSPAGLFVRESGVKCPFQDCAASFSFTPGQSECSVAVRATGTGETTVDLTLSGSAQCTTAQRQWCDSLSGGPAGSVPLQPPPGQSGTSSDTSTNPSSDDSSTETSSPSPTSSS